MKKIVGITGTTCVGKSAVAIELAKLMGTEIISADSMQIYEGMNVGTAKVTSQEMCGITHHMLDVTQPNKDFSSFEYAEAAAQIIDGMSTVPIVVGGTGFYFESLVNPPEFGVGDKTRRQELQTILKEEGLSVLCEKLRLLDYETFSTIDLKNPVRVIRAIEIAEQGQKKSAGKRGNFARYDLQLYVLYRDRSELYSMIDRRVDKMVQDGLVGEVKKLVEKYGVCDTSAFSAIGYKEIISCLRGECNLHEAVEKIKINTRHYAKRQETYFRKMKIAQRIDVKGKTAVEVAQIIFDDFSRKFA